MRLPINSFQSFSPTIHCKEDGGEEEVLVINQVPACIKYYIGTLLGYAATTPAAEKARADCFIMNVCDYIDESRKSFHPVKGSMSFKEQTEEGDTESKERTKTSMPIRLVYFDKI